MKYTMVSTKGLRVRKIAWTIFTILILDIFDLSSGFSCHWNEELLLRKVYPSRWTSSSLECKTSHYEIGDGSVGAHWFPEKLLQISELESDSINSIKTDLESQSLHLMARLLFEYKSTKHACDNIVKNCDRNENSRFKDLYSNRFRDLCCSRRSESILEQMFERVEKETETRVVIGAIKSLQSLLVLGMQYGAKASSTILEGNILSSSIDCDDCEMLGEWDASCTQKLKTDCNRLPGMNLLATMKRKRSPQGAYEVLVGLGVWQRHEDLSLLRSGLPLRFGDDEIKAAEKACANVRDVDQLLNIREDLTHQKVYTIDSASTKEIDDALSVEKFTNSDGSTGNRIWIHIADADRWAPRGSPVFEIAKERVTSLYVPQGSIPMIPEILSFEKMSLNANDAKSSLSLGVELAPDGSIIDSSILVSSSTIMVSYRLTYDDVDEMLEDGVAYSEEWELGALYTAAKTRRDYRIRNGSAEGFVPTQIPQYSISISQDEEAHNNVGIALNIQVSHNGGKNQSMVEYHDKATSTTLAHAAPVSAASMLVTEMMILAGEAIGRWKTREEEQNSKCFMRNTLRLPFRTQPNPDYRSRMREKSIMEDLLKNDIGGGLCHAWYARRFLAPVVISETPSPHSGLGIQCYTQWSSPIRRFGDLQVHAAIKRYLRRKKLIDMTKNGLPIPANITKNDIGCDPERFCTDYSSSPPNFLDADIDFTHGLSCLRTSRVVQRSAQTYWILEFIRRLDRNKTFETIVLGCKNPERKQYVVYIYELGLEWVFNSPINDLTSGTKIHVKATNILPHNGQMTLVQVEL